MKGNEAGLLTGRSWRFNRAMQPEARRLDAFKELPPASVDWHRWFDEAASAYTAAERVAFVILGIDDGNEDRSEVEEFRSFVSVPENELPSAEFVEGLRRRGPRTRAPLWSSGAAQRPDRSRSLTTRELRLRPAESARWMRF